MRLGLVLSGGGARGSFEVGVIAALEQAGLHPQIVSGTSAGALNAGGLAAGFDADRLSELWTSVRDRDVYRLRRDVWRLVRPWGLLTRGNVPSRLMASIGWTWYLHTGRLRRTLVDALGGERVPVVDGMIAVVSAVEKSTGELVRFTSASPFPSHASRRYRVVDLHVDHLMASAAIPLAFRPATVGEERFWDGGIVANTPLAPALAYEPDAVIVVTTATLTRPAPRPRHLGEAFSLLIDNLLRHSLLSDLARARALNLLARQAPEATAARDVDFLVIEPHGLDLGESLRFDPRQAARNIALGRQVGEAALEGWRAEGRLP